MGRLGREEGHGEVECVSLWLGEEFCENVVAGGFSTACVEVDWCEVRLQVEEETVRIVVTLAHVMTH